MPGLPVLAAVVYTIAFALVMGGVLGWELARRRRGGGA